MARTVADFHDQKHEQHLEPDSHGNQKITGDDPLGMILDECSPVLRGRPSLPGPFRLQPHSSTLETASPVLPTRNTAARGVVKALQLRYLGTKMHINVHGGQNIQNQLK